MSAKQRVDTSKVIHASPTNENFFISEDGEYFVKASWLKDLTGLMVGQTTTSTPSFPPKQEQDEYYSLQRFAEESGLKATPGFLKYLGQQMARVARKGGVEIHSEHNTRWGPRNSYPKSMILANWETYWKRYRAIWVGEED